MARILCIETSGLTCSAAICDDKGNVISDTIISDTGEHAKLLTTAISNVANNANTPISELSAIAVSCGPGSYTGLRIGVSTAKGICYAQNLPLIAIPTLQIIATSIFEHQKDASIAGPMIDARRMEVYCAAYDRELTEIIPTQAKIIDENSFSDLRNKKNIHIAGSGAKKCLSTLGNNNISFIDDILPQAKEMSKLAALKFENKEFVDVAYYEPYYLKEYVAVVSKNKVLEQALKR